MKAILIAVAVVQMIPVASASSTLKTSVCVVAKQPTRFDGKQIAVTGQIESDGMERTILTDKNCPETGIAIRRPDHFEGEREWREVFSKGRPGTLDKVITGTLTGVFRWKPRDVPRRVLNLKSAIDLTVTTGRH